MNTLIWVEYEVLHHTQLIDQLLKEGKLDIVPNDSNEQITYHDSCYMGRVNGVYQVPRDVLKALNIDIKEMARSRENGLCCGAGGAQMFKEDEPGDKRVNVERVDETISTGAKTIGANCPFCITMLQDGLKAKDQQENVMVMDISELVLNNLK